MARRLPPFAAVRAFEATARHGHLRLAGEELSITVSALSHQIKALEDYLGIPLFIRSKNTLKLTPIGHEYLADLTRALDLIAAGTARVERERSQESVSINLFPSLAALWLLPRLAAFRKFEADVDVRVITTLDPIDFRSGQIDLAIRYAQAPPESACTTKMFTEESFPVCAPEYAADIRMISRETDIAGLTLICAQPAPMEWTDWFARIGFDGALPTRRIHVDNRALALEASMDGVGIAMGRTPFVNRAMKAGHLRRLSTHTFTDGFNYYLAQSDSALRSRVARRFSCWILEQARSVEAAADIA